MSIPARVGLVAIAWGLVLLLIWAIHPVEGVASFVPVDDPSATEQVSIDRVLGGSNETQPVLIERFQCDSTPLQAATSGAGASSAPTLEEGFEYVDPPCSGEYDAAQAAFWVNAVVIAGIVAASIAVHLRLRNRSAEDPISSDGVMVAAHSDN